MSGIFYYSMFFIIVLVSLLLPGKGQLSPSRTGAYTAVLAGFVIIMIGGEPVHLLDGSDRALYASGFSNIQKGLDTTPGNDPLFFYYQYIVGLLVPSWQGFFLITAILYTGNHLLACRQCCPKQYGLLFLAFIVSFSFFSYGVNTLRAGLAASFLVLGITSYQRKWVAAICLVIAIGFHYSMLLPAMAFIVARFYNRPKLYIGIWFACCILSAVAGSQFETFFSGLTDDSRASYLRTAANSTHYKVGFRIDFILYSLAPIAAGWYYLVVKKVRSEFYSIILNTYILANCFWLLVIRANFSDRFAYLSWFLYPLVIMYPMLCFPLWKRQTSKIALTLFCLEGFTFIMFLR